MNYKHLSISYNETSHTHGLDMFSLINVEEIQFDVACTL